MKLHTNTAEALGVLILEDRQDFERLHKVMFRGVNTLEDRGKDIEAVIGVLSAAVKLMKEAHG